MQSKTMNCSCPTKAAKFTYFRTSCVSRASSQLFGRLGVSLKLHSFIWYSGFVLALFVSTSCARTPEENIICVWMIDNHARCFRCFDFESCKQDTWLTRSNGNCTTRGITHRRSIPRVSDVLCRGPEHLRLGRFSDIA